MTTLDDKLVPKAFELVEKFGQFATFTTDELEQSGYDPSTGHVTPGAPTNTVLKVTPPEEYDEYYAEKHKDIIIFGDMKTYLPAYNLPFDIEKVTEVNIEGELFSIVGIEKIYTGNEIALYELQLRQ
jgi:hypothetical protein